MSKLNIGLSLIGILAGITIHAQESTNTSGGNHIGPGGSNSFSIGQVVYTSHSDTTGILSQGVQQAYEIYSVGTSELVLEQVINLFPNPTTDLLTIEIENPSQNLSYQLMNTNGKMIQSDILVSNLTTIDMQELPAASYFIIIYQDSKKVQSFKIIKN